MTDTPETDANDDAWAYDVQYGTFNALIDAGRGKQNSNKREFILPYACLSHGEGEKRP
tara:strand:+ start:546 stop:719 length:174 start_codon:yes stop_codon:yes gene_type:complete